MSLLDGFTNGNVSAYHPTDARSQPGNLILTQLAPVRLRLRFWLGLQLQLRLRLRLRLHLRIGSSLAQD
jgi:hypothetical protein